MTRSVLITGSSGHLGLALRWAFEAQGDQVIGVDAPGTWVRHTSGGVYRHIECDLEGSDVAAIMTFRPDVVVCNAKVESWKLHNFLATRATSAVVNIGSIYGVLGNDPSLYTGTEVDPTPAWYAASKGALVALTRWQSTNLAPVRSNCVCPGGIFRAHSDNFRERYEDKVPLRRMATEADIVPLVLFLADNTKSGYITGQCIMVDGGYSSW